MTSTNPVYEALDGTYRSADEIYERLGGRVGIDVLIRNLKAYRTMGVVESAKGIFFHDRRLVGYRKSATRSLPAPATRTLDDCGVSQ